MAVLRALIASTALLAGCTSFQHPLGAADVPFDQRLVGSWTGSFEEDETFELIVQRDGHATITTSDPRSAPETESVQMRTTRIDDLEIVNVGLSDEGKTYWQPVRYELAETGELRAYLCDDEFWYGAVKERAIAGTASRGQHGPSTWVTASRGKLLSFARAHSDSVFVREPIVLQRTR